MKGGGLLPKAVARRAAGPARGGVCLGVLAAALAMPSCSRADPSPATAPGAAGAVVPVTTALAIRKTMPLEIRTFGTVEPLATVSIKSQVAGQIAAVHFKEGTDVRQGQLLFTVDPRPFEAALKQAQARLAMDRAQSDNARREAQRDQALVGKGFVNQEQADRSRSTAEAMEAAVRADEAAVEIARLQWEYCFIRSPLDGRAGKLLVDAGNVIKDKDLPLAVIHQVCPIYVTFAVPENQLMRIRQHMADSPQPLEVRAIIPEAPEPAVVGELTFLDNEVDRSTGTIRLKATFANRDRRLWPGQFVHVILTLARQPDAVVVPSPAVQAGQQGTYVFVVRTDQTVEMRPIVVGRTVGVEAVVASGLAPGERVVTDGHLRLAPGVRVALKDRPAAGTSQP